MIIPFDQQVIEKAKAGDQHAFRILVETFQRLVYSIAFRFTGDSAEAEDLVQECFVRVWKNLNRYKPEYPLKTWVAKIITNLCLDFLKSVKTKNAARMVTWDEKISLADATQAETELNASELHSIVLKLANQLTPKQRAAFVLRDLEMMEVKEVREILGITAGALKSNLYYARSAMKESITKYYKLPEYEVPGM
jgi:RNA polymerase sigma-70 factor, ECF subfamily